MPKYDYRSAVVLPCCRSAVMSCCRSRRGETETASSADKAPRINVLLHMVRGVAGRGEGLWNVACGVGLLHTFKAIDKLKPSSVGWEATSMAK